MIEDARRIVFDEDGLERHVISDRRARLQRGPALEAMVPAQEAAVIEVVRIGDRRFGRVRIPDLEVQLVVGPEGQEIDVVVRGCAPVQVALVIVILRRKLEIGGGEERQEDVDPAPPRREREREVLGERAVDQERAVEQIDLGEAVPGVGARLAAVDLDHAAEPAPVLHAVAAG